jgi:hypothetical protein
MFENRVLKRISGPKKGGYRRLHNLYLSLNLLLVENKTRRRTQQEGMHPCALGKPYINS